MNWTLACTSGAALTHDYDSHEWSNSDFVAHSMMLHQYQVLPRPAYLRFADDSDTDGHMDSWDNCWTVPNDQKDTNGNGKGDACGMASMGRTGLTETGIGQQT